MARPAEWGGLNAEGVRSSVTEASPVGDPTFPNREELPYAVRVIGGWFPILILFGLFYGVMLFAWLSNPTSLLIAGIVVAWTAAGVAASAWLARSLRARTPTHIEVAESGITAVWSGGLPRREAVPFDRIRSVDPSHWRWISAYKASHYGFTPASFQYEKPAADGSDRWGPRGLNQEVVYLTDSNLKRLQAAFDKWGGLDRIRNESPLPTDINLPDPSENPDLLPPGWVKCANCGAPLKSHLEIEAGLCASCLRSDRHTH